MSSIWTDFKDIEQINMVNVPGGMSYKTVKKTYPRADIISSLTLFVLANGLNFVRFEDENVKDGYLGGNEGIGIKNRKDLVWCTHKEAYSSNDIRDYCAGFPPLVKDGKKYVDENGDFYWGNKYSEYIDGTHKRLLVGFNGTRIIIVASDNELTLDEAADIMIRFGCTYAINADGGDWSPHLQIHSDIYRKGYRKNATWLLIYLDKRKAFVDLLLDQVGNDYVYGAKGKDTTPALFKWLVATYGKAHYYFNGYSAEKSVGDGKPDDDCSGLMTSQLIELGVITEHKNARGIYNEYCYPITFDQLKNGDLVFYENLGHVGAYYDGKVINAKSTKEGVVISDTLYKFKIYGRVKYL